MKKFALATGAATLLSLGAITIPTVAQAQPGSIIVQVAPPQPRAERMPPPRRGYVWAPGHYEWRGNNHVWMRGYWVQARPGYAWRAPEWRERDGRWEYRQGAWDRDGDGIRNRNDRDRDGDGVRNRNDRRPNNPNRY